MEIRKLIDTFGDDIYTLALIITKDFDAAKQIFAIVTSKYEEYSDNITLFELAKLTYKACEEVEANNAVEIFTELELSGRLEALLNEVIQRPQAIRTIIHLFYENDLDTAQICKVIGESERYVKSVLSELSSILQSALESDYKVICSKIHAADSLKAYVIRSAETGGRMFEAKGEPVPVHTWKRWQKVAVVIIAAVATIAVMVVIPIIDQYRRMLDREAELDYEEAETSEIFRREDDTPDEKEPKTLIEQIMDLF